MLSIEQRDDKIVVRVKRGSRTAILRGKTSSRAPDRIVIVGGGAAGFAVAERLRKEHFLISAKSMGRPNIVRLSDR